MGRSTSKEMCGILKQLLAGFRFVLVDWWLITFSSIAIVTIGHQHSEYGCLSASKPVKFMK